MTSLLPRLLGSLTGSPAAWGPAAAACTRLPWPCTCNPTAAAHHYTTSAASSSTPADAQQQQPQRAQPQPSLRSLKAKANLEYSRKRAAWRRQLGALRRQWLEEHQEAQHAAAAERQRDQEERQQLASLRASQKQLDHGQGQVQRAIRDAERHVEAVSGERRGVGSLCGGRPLVVWLRSHRAGCVWWFEDLGSVMPRSVGSHWGVEGKPHAW